MISVVESKSLRVALAVALVVAGGCRNASTSAPITEPRAQLREAIARAEAETNAAYARALAAQGLSPVQLERVPGMPSSPAVVLQPHVEGRRLTIAGGGTFARNAEGQIVVVQKTPNVTRRAVDVSACEEGPRTMIGGAGQPAVYELPEGTAFGGEVTVSYASTEVVGNYWRQKPDGTPCPPVAQVID